MKNDQPAAPGKPTGIAYLIGRIDHVLSRRLRDSLGLLGLSAAQYTALSVLDTQKQLSNAQLAERSMISPQSANEMVKAMEARGWIVRQADAHHGRIIHLRLSDEGSALLRQGHAAVAQLEQAMLAELGVDQRSELHAQLRVLLRSLSAIVL
ncbi:MarR family transcriptional regulator [Massilia sp. Root351]|jgi:DNA-binding MarR family transcriptional regulator|uniref:MarR family winged helix-turn-helix transcriptional regulator n=1 Tax=Massilia sp. Root351 TaxID=1736522 RepID=UPI000709F9CD|nr:MarR family transcriptional regulator [Massilia sp. Root351]KQV82619.1 MarR family transcriptional regulator [Massilia sp. Root351]